MSTEIALALKKSFYRSMNLLDQFIEVCPDEIWKKKFGGWPIWQQVYHSLCTVNFFVGPTDTSSSPRLFAQEVGSLTSSPDRTPTRAEIKEYASRMRQVAEEYMDKLTDDLLPQTNAGLASRLDKEVTHTSTMALLSGHILYHLGTCDAALREDGREGVF